MNEVKQLTELYHKDRSKPPFAEGSSSGDLASTHSTLHNFTGLVQSPLLAENSIDAVGHHLQILQVIDDAYNTKKTRLKSFCTNPKV
jgi:hypothetical protein